MYFQNKDVFSRFELEKQIGQGGMSKVFLAKDLRLGRTVAVKIITNQHSSTYFRDMAIEEAKIMARLNHPNIVQIYEILETEEFVALITEYIEGMNFKQLLNEKHSDLAQNLKWLVQISQALVAAHKQNIVHCDLKASNILIDQEGNIKVADFGIAKIMTNTQTKGGKIYGSPTCMSPEQLNGKSTDHRSDLFSLGIFSFLLIAKQHPFEWNTGNTVCNKMLTNKAMNAFDIVPAIPPILAKLLNQLIAYKAEQRPSETSWVASQFQRVLVALTQNNILEQDTIEIIPNKNVDKKTFENKTQKNLLIGVITTLVFSIFVSAIWSQLHLTGELRRIAILSPIFSNNNSYSKYQQHLISAAIDNTLRDMVINNDDLLLISRRESINYTNPAQIAFSTGATDIVETNIDCSDAQCSVSLSLINGDDWSVTSQQHWPIIFEDYNEVALNTQKYFAALLPSTISDTKKQESIPNDDYQRYITLYSKIQFQGDYSSKVLKELTLIIKHYPYFYSAYGLLREGTLNLFHQTKKMQTLEQLQTILDNAPAPYRYSQFHAIDEFWLAISKEDFIRAGNQMELAKKAGADISTLTELEAYFYFMKNDLDKAIEYYHKALKIRRSTTSLHNLALAQWWSGDLDGAKKTLEQLLVILPDDYSSNHLLATIFLLKGSLQSAIDMFEAAIAIEPKASDMNNLSIAFMLTGQIELSRDLATQAVSQYPDNPTYILNLADSELILGNRDKAHLLYQKVINLHEQENNLASWLEKAQAHIHLGHSEASVRAIGHAKRLGQDNGEVAFTAALIYTLLGEEITALIEVENAVKNQIGVTWFKLPWFDALCEKSDFKEIMGKGGEADRCPM